MAFSFAQWELNEWEMDRRAALSAAETEAAVLGSIRYKRIEGPLDLEGYRIDALPSGIGALERLPGLLCSRTMVADLSPLAELRELRSLVCWKTAVADLSPLAALTSLEELNCWGTLVADLSPLAALTSLEELNCSGTQVSDLAPLAKLTRLKLIRCSQTNVTDLSPLRHLPNLEELYVFRCPIVGIPSSTLSQDSEDNCLSRLRTFWA